MSDSSKVRLVRCPKCENLLPELEDYSVYQCGGCGAVLRGNNYWFCLLSFFSSVFGVVSESFFHLVLCFGVWVIVQMNAFIKQNELLYLAELTNKERCHWWKFS